MAYLGKIARVKTSMRATVLYLEKESRSEASIHVAGISAPADPSLFMTAMRGINAHHQVPADRIDARATVISFAADEVDPEDDQACADAFEVVRATAQEAWGDRGFPALLHGQRDGQTGLFHVHVLLPNVELDTGRAMRGDDHSWERAALILDRQMKAAGMQHTHEAMRERVQKIREGDPERRQRHPETHADRRARMAGRQAFPDRVAGVLREAMSSNPKDLGELDGKLREHGLTVRVRGKNTVFEELEPAPGRKRAQSSRHDRVARAYELAGEPVVPCSPEGLAAAFAQSQQIASLSVLRRQRREEEQERQERKRQRENEQAQELHAAATPKGPAPEKDDQPQGDDDEEYD